MLPACRKPLFLLRNLMIAAFMLAALCACKPATPRLSPLPSGSVVLAFGDSVTYGTGASKGEDWPTLLAAGTGWRVVNEGIPGDTAQEGKGRLQTLLNAHRPALVIVEIGGNDFLKRRAHKEVKEDIRNILSTVRKSGATAVLVAVPEFSLLAAARPSDASLYAELGNEENVPVIPAVFANVLSQPELRTDRVHPNAAGYRRMAEGIHAELKRTGLVRN